jgi:hypothetical protein
MELLGRGYQIDGISGINSVEWPVEPLEFIPHLQKGME